MPLVLVAILCGLGGLVSGWFAARQSSRYLPPTQRFTIRTRAAIAVTCAILSAFIGVRYAGQTVLASYLVLTAVAVGLSFIDARTHRLPRELTYPATAACLILLAYAAWVDDRWPSALTAVGGGVLAFGLMGLVWLVGRGQLGGGDVRLAPLLGVNLGYLGLLAVPIGLLTGFVLAAVVAAVGLATRRFTSSTQIAIGPYLCGGTFITLLWFT